MRTDVKVGIALGAIVLIIAGAYYGASKEPDIQLAEADDDVRDRNKRTLRDLLAPPPNTSTTSQDETPSRAVPSQPGPAPRAQVAASDEGMSSKPDDPARQAPRQEADSDRHASVNIGDPSSASRATEAGSTAMEPQATDSPKSSPEPIGRSVERSSMPVVSNPPGAASRSLASPSARHNESGSLRPTSPKPATPLKRARVHVVAPGDNFSALAERYYGSQTYAGILLEANPNVDPRRMKIGSRITIPPLDAAGGAATAPAVAREAVGRRYHVREGDSLYAIAEANLGNGARWSEIYELNKAVIGGNPSHLTVGVVLTLPTY